MLRIRRIVTGPLRYWGAGDTEPNLEPASSNKPTLQPASLNADSWVNVDEELVSILPSAYSVPSCVCSDDSACVSRADERCSTPTSGSALKSATLANDSYNLDTTTFSPHATHLLPSDSNGTWHDQALHNPSETVFTFREVLKRHAYERDIPTLLHKLEQLAGDRNDDINEWLNQTFVDCDLVETHNRARRLVPVLSMPNMRQIDHVVNTVTDLVQSLRMRRSEPELLHIHRDKYTFARCVGKQARFALIEQGVCKEWQFLSEEHAKMLHFMDTALMYTFTRIHKLHTHVPLDRAKPRWIPDQDLHVWRLELDVGVVGVEIGPESDRSLIELGYIDTGFSLPESCGCVYIADVDRRVQVVEDEWQLLD